MGICCCLLDLQTNSYQAEVLIEQVAGDTELRLLPDCP
jgi:hypothetical protein